MMNIILSVYLKSRVHTTVESPTVISVYMTVYDDTLSYLLLPFIQIEKFRIHPFALYTIFKSLSFSIHILFIILNTTLSYLVEYTLFSMRKNFWN